MTFPASDPVSIQSSITRIEVAPEKVDASTDHQNAAAIEAHNQQTIGCRALGPGGDCRRRRPALRPDSVFFVQYWQQYNTLHFVLKLYFLALDGRSWKRTHSAAPSRFKTLLAFRKDAGWTNTAPAPDAAQRPGSQVQWGTVGMGKKSSALSGWNWRRHNSVMSPT
jgi:hypothetical protein